MTYTSPLVEEIEFSIGFLTIGTGPAAKLYSVESMYSVDPNNGAQNALKVRVIQHPATGPLVVKYEMVFAASNLDGRITHDECAVKDINGDGIEELVIKYGKLVVNDRRHTYFILNMETGALIRKLTLIGK